MIAQMADRCYLEKCRDRLYKEFVLGGVAVENAKPGEYMVRYKSGEDLLKQDACVSMRQVMRERLEQEIQSRLSLRRGVVRRAEPVQRRNPTTTLRHLVKRVIASGDWSLLRRNPPYFLGIVSAAADVEQYVKAQLASLTGRAIEKNELLMPV